MNKVILDEFNSHIFGLKMGNLYISDNNHEEIEKLLSNACLENYKHLSIKVNTKSLNLCNYLLQNGFQIVDTLLTYVFNYELIHTINYHYDNSISIQPVLPEDVNVIKNIAHDSFVNDRFHNDAFLDNSLCDYYYEQWIQNSCNGYADTVLVAKNENGKIIGFGTGRYTDTNRAVLDLNAVASHARGKGVGTAVIWEIIKYFEGKVDTLTIGTQINNYAALKTWSKLGLTIYESKYILHKKIN